MPYSADEINKINKITTQFYKHEQNSFSATRQHAWDGWNLCLPYLEKNFCNKGEIKVLDLGCGNLRFEKFLNQNFPENKFRVLAIDNNCNMANIDGLDSNMSIKLKNVDILNSLLENKLLFDSDSFDLVVAFGLMHHIPCEKFRYNLIKTMLQASKEDSLVILSFWQFSKSERLKNKAIITTDKLTLEQNIQLEDSDYFLPWQNTNNEYRFCHDFSDLEINNLIDNLKCKILAEFCADGGSEKLNKYVLLTK